MPKHIKVSKHVDTRKFYVSDVCEFLSVEVSAVFCVYTKRFLANSLASMNFFQELVAYYQHNSLGSSFPGVDTTLRYPYRDMTDVGGNTRPRSTSATPAPPAPLVPSPRNMGRTASPTSDTQQSERWADALFAFHAEYPDELTIDVCC